MVVVLPTTILMGYGLVVEGHLVEAQGGRFQFDFDVPTISLLVD